MFFLQELHLLRTNAHFFPSIDAILSLFQSYASMHILPYYRQISRIENLIGAAQHQNNLALGITKFCAHLKEKTQILSVLITHANTVPIAQSAKYGRAKSK